MGERHDAIARVLFRVLVLNLAVAAAKLTLGYATGAVSVISDGFHSLTDSASNVMGLIGLRAARKPPDADHPYGHRKYETLSAAAIFVFLLFVVVEVVRTSFDRLAAGSTPTVTPFSFGVMIATLGVTGEPMVRPSSRTSATKRRAAGRSPASCCSPMRRTPAATC